MRPRTTQRKSIVPTRITPRTKCDLQADGGVKIVEECEPDPPKEDEEQAEPPRHDV